MAILDQHGKRFDGVECKHTNCPVEFDPDVVRGMSAHAVRQLYPRFWGKCPDCGAQMIAYASAEHYIAGDW